MRRHTIILKPSLIRNQKQKPVQTKRRDIKATKTWRIYLKATIWRRFPTTCPWPKWKSQCKARRSASWIREKEEKNGQTTTIFARKHDAPCGIPVHTGSVGNEVAIEIMHLLSLTSIYQSWWPIWSFRRVLIVDRPVRYEGRHQMQGFPHHLSKIN